MAAVEDLNLPEVQKEEGILEEYFRNINDLLDEAENTSNLLWLSKWCKIQHSHICMQHSHICMQHFIFACNNFIFAFNIFIFALKSVFYFHAATIFNFCIWSVNYTPQLYMETCANSDTFGLYL